MIDAKKTLIVHVVGLDAVARTAFTDKIEAEAHGLGYDVIERKPTNYIGAETLMLRRLDLVAFAAQGGPPVLAAVALDPGAPDLAAALRARESAFND